MGVVYRARDVRLERIVALKLLAPRCAAGEEGRHRFLREARAISALDHPNVCTLYEIGETGEGELFLAMAFCAGESLRARIERGPLPLAEALDVAAQVAAGLAAAHQRGVIHRDVKPANVMVLPDGQVRVVDFGIAKLADADTVLTRSGTALGTAGYMSPEQLLGEALDARTDVWSLGVVLYEMLAGRLPFEGAGEEAVVHSILHGAPLPLSRHVAGAPPAAQRIVERALARRPAARYPRIEEMRGDLLTVAAGEAPADPEATLLDVAVSRIFPSAPAGLSGRTIAHYRIAELLGGGGMGVVYRAEDSRLGRSVALKVLAPELGRDPEARARFLTEARTASALDHPNLCTILEVGEIDEGMLFLAMPCYDGETLESRIARGPLPVEEALDVTLQAARGLAKTHGHGIVHRDIKPANLFLTRDGVVKILDFGIAKLRGAAGPTRRASSLGTPAYMAPEQARGEEVDARADVWSLGVVLYEMLAGRRPFTGGVDSMVIDAVLHRDPEPLARLRPEVSRELEGIAGRLLAKDPEQRPADGAAVLAELRKSLGLSAGSLTWQPAGPPRPRRRLSWRTALAVALALGAAAAGLVVWQRARRMAAPPPVQATRLTDFPGKESFPSLSPDGNFFAYARAVDGDLDIFLQRVGGGNPISLTEGSPADDTQPAFSPDGSQIAFRSEREGGGIFLMGAMGDSVRRLTDFGFNPAWSPDGREIAVATEGVTTPFSRYSRSQIVRVELATGARRPFSLEDGVQPSWSPNGLRIAFWGITRPGARRVISTVPAQGGRPVPVVDDAFYNWSPVWAPDGRFLYFASDRGGSMNLWRVAIDEASGRVLGEPQPLTTPSEWSALPSFSRNGQRIVYATDDSRSFLEQVALDPQAGRVSGAARMVYQSARSIRGCDVSPDGEWIVFRTAAPREDLYLIRSDGRDLRQLTDDPERDRGPRWSPDGRLILFSSNRSGKYEVWTIRPDGSNLTQVTRLPGDSVVTPLWSPDGRRLGFTYGARGTAILDFGGPAARPPRLLPPAGAGRVFSANSWSQDGRWLAGHLLQKDEHNLPGIVLWSLPDGTWRRLTDGGAEPLFFRHGPWVLYAEAEALRLADRTGGGTRELLTPPPGSSYLTAGIGQDDRMVCAVRTTDQGDAWILSFAR